MRAHLSLLRLNYSLNKFKYKVMQKNRRKWFGTSPNRKFILLLQTIFLIGGLLCGGNTRVWGQAVPKVSLNLKHATFVKVIESLRQQTGYEFVFNAPDVEHVKDVSLSLKDVSLRTAMDSLLQGKGLAYSITGQTVVIKKQMAQSAAKLIQISGRVVDEKGDAIAGATIMVVGTTQGVASDVEGRYTIAAKPDDVLRVSFIGYETKTVGINGKEKLNIRLILTEENLEEVVVTGVVNRKAESYTGAAVSVKGDELRMVGNQNVFASLKNLDPTLYIMDNLDFGSDPNMLPDMMMRGRTGTQEGLPVQDLKGNYDNKPNQPLFILDGFEASAERIFDLDMNLVESLTILKDAAAKALYGSKAANGVVVIETRKLTSTKPRITYTGSIDLQMPDLSSYDLAHSLEKLDVEYNGGVFDDDSYSEVMRYATLRRQVASGLDTYWLSKPVRFGYGQQHSLYVELGKDDLRMSLNFSYNDNKGVMKKSDRRVLSGAVNVAYNYNNKFRFQNNLHVNGTKSSDSPYGSFREYAVLNPYEYPYESDGTLKKELSNGNANPLSNGLSNMKLLSSYSSFSNNFNMEWTVVEGLRIRGRFGFSYKVNDADRYYPRTHTIFKDVQDVLKRGKYEVNNGKETTLSGDINLNYARTFNDKHNIFVNAGYNLSETKNREVIQYTVGFPSERMDDIMFAQEYAGTRPQGATRISRDLGILAMFSYTYEDRYLFDATYRANAASMFGTNNRWGTFWSLGVGWNMHREEFAQSWEWLETFKLRASLGLTGNQNFRQNNSIAVYQYELGRFYDSMVGSRLQNMENPDLKWEKRMDYNVGIDAEFFNLNVRLDLYNSLTENRNSTMPISPSTGFGTVATNMGSVRNKGVEVYLAYTVWQSRKGYLRLNGSIAHNKNRLVTVSDDMKKMSEKYTKGEDMSAIKGVYSYGVDPATGLELFRGKDGSRTFVYNEDDRIVLGVSDPKYRGIFGLSGEYKGIGLSISCRFLGGGQMVNRTLVTKVDVVDIKNNVDRRVLTEGWMKPGDHVYFLRRIPGVPYRGTEYDPNSQSYPELRQQTTSRFVQDRKELDIGSLSVYYDFNRKWIKHLGMERMRFSVYVNDVYKWSSMGVERGIDYPFAHMVSLQLSATF